MGFIPMMRGRVNNLNCNKWYIDYISIDSIKEKNHMIISTNTQKTFKNIQYLMV